MFLNGVLVLFGCVRSIGVRYGLRIYLLVNDSYWRVIHTLTKVRLVVYDQLLDIIHESRTSCFLGSLSNMWQCLWHPGPLHASRISCSAKKNWLVTTIKYLRVMALSYMCDGAMGAPLEWRHSNLIPLYCNV